jgi:DNA polymerase III epsilon subunit-like protein
MSDVERYFSVDVETSGPVPGEYSLLSIGACVVGKSGAEFSCRLQPISRNADPAALAVTGLSLEDLERTGAPPAEAMRRFDEWTRAESGEATPVFIGLNAAFDWSFVNYYFHRFLGANPFGIAPLDLKSLYMGVTGCAWRDTRSSNMVRELHPRQRGDHDALNDARAQAELFELILARFRH